MLNSNEPEEDKYNFKTKHFYKVNYIYKNELECVFEPWKIENEKNLNNWYKYLSVLMHLNYNQNSEQFI